MSKVWLGLGFIFTLVAISISNQVFASWIGLTYRMEVWNEDKKAFQELPNYEICNFEYNERVRKNNELGSTALLMESIRDPYLRNPDAGLANCKVQVDQGKVNAAEWLEQSSPDRYFYSSVLWPTVGLVGSASMAMVSFLKYRRLSDN
jgi:hypothetical protein